MLGNQRGLTLVEVIVVNVFVIVGIIAIFCLLTLASIQLIRAEGNSVATHLAHSKMEEILHAKYEDILFSEEQYGTIHRFYEYRRIVIVEEDLLAPNTKIVRVIVLWKVPTDGNESTEDGEEYDPLKPDLHRSLIELIAIREAYSG